MKKLLTITLPAILITLIILELVFRFVIPAAQRPYFEMTKEGSYNIGKYNDRNGPCGQNTASAFAQIKGDWCINNHGWNNLIDYEYERDTSKTRICIIGDSYIEALNLDFENSFVHQLQLQLGEDYQVYSFGIGGSPLSQYVYYARYVEEYYHPDLLIVNIVHNDFDESLINYGDNRNLLFAFENDSLREVAPKLNLNTSNQTAKRILVKSAIARYLFYNLQINRIFNKIRIIRFRKKPSNNDETIEDKKNLPQIEISEVTSESKIVKEIIDYSIDEIKLVHKAKPLLFLMDGARKDLLKGKESDLIWLNQLVIKECKEKSLPIIDLHPIFKNYFNSLDTRKIKRKRTMNQIDSHWDKEEHQIVTDTLLRAIKNFKID